jgi:hypothetical protein
MAELDSSYVIAEFDTATMQLLNTGNSMIYYGKFHAILTWAEKEQSDYYDVFYVPDDFANPTQYSPRMLYLTDYYRSLYVRLYNFDGEAVTDVNPAVITWVEEEQEGQTIKRITAAQGFTNYQRAIEYRDSLGEGNHAIVGVNPFISPVPLETAQGFQRVYSSEQGTSMPSVGFMPEVKIFEYTGGE